MNEIFSYIGSSFRRVTVGFRDSESGKTRRLYRKLDGANHQLITDAVNKVRQHGHEPVVLEVYRPNGSAEILCKVFLIARDGSVQSTSVDRTSTASERKNSQVMATTTQQTKSMETSWKDYALKTEQEKVSKLEAELRRVNAENRTLDHKVREFEKEMIKKDHELEKKEAAITTRSSLEGVIERVSSNQNMMNLFAGVASRVLGMPPASESALRQEGEPSTTQQYIQNIGQWLSRQPTDAQEAFYQMVFHLTNQKDIRSAAMHLTNVLKGAPMSGTHN